MAVSPVAFYAVANEPHFLGLVALLNSLRLQGHGDPLLVADCGLAGWQRELLVPHAEVVEADRGIPPYLLKPVLPRARPTEKMVLLDVDLVAVRPLTPLFDETAAVVAFADPVAHRFHPEWAEFLDLPPLRPGTYLNSGSPSAASRRPTRPGPISGPEVLRSTRPPWAVASSWPPRHTPSVGTWWRTALRSSPSTAGNQGAPGSPAAFG